MSAKARWKTFGINTLVYLAITVATLIVADVALMALNLFPPEAQPGDPEVGWVSAYPTGEMHTVSCVSFTDTEPVRFTRNEEGLRTAHSSTALKGGEPGLTIAVGGDSHTDLCAPNEQIHFGVMERELKAAGVDNAVYSYGAGKYSPLQAYLAVKRVMDTHPTDVFVLNLYTGNDFYDMLRVDDRPFLTASGSGYTIAEPVWYQLDPPDLRRRSRVLFLLRSVADRTGVLHVFVRVRYLHAAATEQGKGVGSVFRYMKDLRSGMSPEIDYQAAFIAQILNQQLFFHHFPGSQEESVKRVQALLALVRQENPDVLLVMSPIPSYQLVQEWPVDEAFLRVFERLPVSYDEGLDQEGELYESLRRLAAEEGWLFVDNLRSLRAYSGTERLFNASDYHIEPVASEIIGAAQAALIADFLEP